MKLHIVIISLLLCVPLSAQEGFTINSIEFKGNETFEKSDFLLLMEQVERKPWYKRLFFGTTEASRYSELILRRDFSRIINLYKIEGFLSAKIDTFHVKAEEDPDSEDYDGVVHLTIHISENKPTLIGTVTTELVRTDSSADLQAIETFLKPLREQFKLQAHYRYRDEDLLADKDLLSRELSNRGYPFARIQPQPTLKENNKRVDINLVIQSGPFCRIGDIEVEGNDKVSTSLIRKQLAMREGDTYAMRRLEKTRQQIYALGVFSLVSLKVETENLADPRRLPVDIVVREAPRLTTKIGVGWGKEDRFRGYTEITRLGFLGGARRQTLFAKHSYLEPIRLSWEVVQPAFLSPRNTISMKPFYRKQREEAFSAERIGGSLSLFRTAGRYTRTSISYTLEQVNSNESGTDYYNNSQINLTISRDSSKPLFVPKTGMFSSLSTTFSGLGFNSLNYGKILLEVRRYKEIHPGLVVAGKAKAGHIFTWSIEDFVPLEELFFAGGSNSVRGWYRQQISPFLQGENSKRYIGGRNLFETSLELRFPIRSDFRGALFWDGGDVWENRSPAENLREQNFALKDAFGFGLRYFTPIGPIRLDFALPRGDTVTWRNFRYHLSVGQPF